MLEPLKRGAADTQTPARRADGGEGWGGAGGRGRGSLAGPDPGGLPWPGGQRERGVGVAEVVEMAKWLDAGRDLGCLPVTAAEAAEVDVPTARVREQQ